MTNIAIIGEAYGEQEEREHLPFVGASGYELTKMLAEAGIHRADCFLTNVFNLRPQGNKIETLCGGKAEGIKGYPALIKAKYVRREFIPELERLADELTEVNPNVIICLGNTPTWAMLGATGISKIRGTTTISTHTATGFKLLPTYHPAAVLRQWELRPVTVLDLMKAGRESHYPEIRRPHRKIWIEPELADCWTFYENYIKGCSLLSVDIETAGNQITCIGFAPSPDLALVIPILDRRKRGRNYWATQGEELQAWEFIRFVLASVEPKLFQNGLYDIAFLWRAYGIKVMNAAEDTMLLHHALQPESLKGLGFLGSVYCDEGAWKTDRKNVTTIKGDA